MTIVNVAFEDSADAVINGYSPSPFPEGWANTGTVDTSDARWKTYYDAQGPFIQMGLPVPTDAAA